MILVFNILMDVLLAKRVRANRPPEKSTSVSSAEDNRLMRSKMSLACSLVNMGWFSSSLCLFLCVSGLRGELASFICASYLILRNREGAAP